MAMGATMPTRDSTEQNPSSRVRDVIEKVGVGMLTTQFGGGLRAPLQPSCAPGRSANTKRARKTRTDKFRPSGSWCLLGG